MAATGGTPAQARRVVMAGAVVLGGLASVIGVVAGIGIGWVLVPILQHYSGSWFGPFDVPWLHLVGIAAFGLLSAFLASAVPALIASRQDVVAVLAGRRGDRRPSLRSPLVGLILLGAGIAGAAYGAKASANGEFYIAGAAIVAVLGMILLVPVVLALVSRLSSRLPAHAAVRRAGRRPAPLADRAGGGGRGGDRRGRGRPRDRHVQRRATERGDLHPDADVRRRPDHRVGGLVGVPVGRGAGGPGRLRRGAPRDPVPRGGLPQRDASAGVGWRCWTATARRSGRTCSSPTAPCRPGCPA